MRKAALILLLLFAAAPARAQLSLDDFTVPAGREAVVLALAESGGDAAQPYALPNTGTLLGGDIDVAPDVIISRVRLQESCTQILFNRVGGGAFSNHLTDDAMGHLLTDGGQLDAPVEEIGSGFARFDEGDGSNFPICAGLTGAARRFVFAITVPEGEADNCDMYFGGIDLAAPSDFKLGGLDPVRIYYGSQLVCGDAA